MKSNWVAPLAAVAIAGGFFGVSAISAASADEQPQGQQMHLGKEAEFYTPDEAAEKFSAIVSNDPALEKKQAAVAISGAPAMFAPTDEEGNKYSYEIGYIESVAATASRCIQISDWVKTNPKEAQALSVRQYETYSSVPAIAGLSDPQEQLNVMKEIAGEKGITPVEAEAIYACGVFGLNGGEA